MQWIHFNWLSIKSKLIVMLLAVSSSSIFVTAYLGYRSGKANLTNRVFSQLTSVRASKAYQIESYFKTIHNHIQTLSNDPSVATAIADFTTTYKELNTTQLPKGGQERIESYYQNEFLARLAKTEEGEPVLKGTSNKRLF